MECRTVVEVYYMTWWKLTGDLTVRTLGATALTYVVWP